MDEKQILHLLQCRNPEAIRHLSEAYGSYCRQIAKNILSNEQDVEECLNDTFLNVWNAIPPACPDNLGAYTAAVTRNLAFSRYRRDCAEKRGGGNIPLVLSELSDLVSRKPSPEQEMERKELTQAMNEFIAALPHWKRYIFIHRYWYADSVADIARKVHRTQAYVSMTLTRLRRKLHDHLTERGIDL